MKKYHHCVKFTYPLSFQTRIPKVDQHSGIIKKHDMFDWYNLMHSYVDINGTT